MKVTESIKDTYNEHLIVSRSFKRKPFKVRKNFKGFETDDRIRYYYRLSKWFENHPEINSRLFFEATLYFHRDEDVVHIREYCKSKALTNYVQYCKILDSIDLENPKSLERCIESFKFIRDFCKEKHIHPSQYLTHKEPRSNFSFLVHIKRHRVCLYSLFAYHEFFSILKDLFRDHEVWNFYLGDSDFSPYFYLKRWEGGVRYSKVAIGALEKISC